MGLPCGTFQEKYAQDMAIFRTRLHKLELIVFLTFLFTLPLYISDRWMTFIIIIGITVITVHGLNIMTGLCDQISLGQAAFMAVGAYTSGLLYAKLGWPYWLALPCAGLSAGIVGLVFGLPSVRVKGFYLILTTVAAQFIVIFVILQLYDITGGVDGLPIPRIEFPDVGLTFRQNYFYLVVTLACLATFFAKNLARTRVGRAFIAIRDNDLAAEVMGINLFRYKLLAFFIGCTFAGVAGSLLVHFYCFAAVDQFTLLDSVWYLGMLIVGGMGSTMGAIFGVVFLRLLAELITISSPLIASTFPAIAAEIASALSLIVHGLVIILFIIFEPRGLAHRWEIVKGYFRLWPLSYD